MRKLELNVLLIAFISLIAFSCNKKEETKTDPIVDPNAKVQVKLQEVVAEKVEQLYEYTAIVEANAVNNIAPTVPGRIDKIFVEVGDYVRAGQKLVQMDASSLEQAKTQLDNLEVTFKRIDELYKVGGVSKSDWDAQKTALNVARTSYNNLLTNTQLTSPISGIVTLRNYDSGDIYAGNPVLQIQQITPVKMNINVSEAQFTAVKKGMNADIALDVYKDEAFHGKVSLIYPTIDARTHTFPVEISVANQNSKVRPGMYARVTMNFGTSNHVVIPDIAVIKQQGSGDRYVYVYKDGKVSYNKVVLGRRMGDKYEIISGVEDGDMVVISGQTKLTNGKEVEVVQ